MMWFLDLFKKHVPIRDYLIEEANRTTKWEYTWDTNAEGLPHGKWKMVYKDGRIYQWERVNWKKEWKWFIAYKDWSEYEWGWKNDMPHWRWRGFLIVKEWRAELIYWWEFKNWIIHWEWSMRDAMWWWYEWERVNWKREWMWSESTPSSYDSSVWWYWYWEWKNDKLIWRGDEHMQIVFSSFKERMDEKVKNKFHDEDNQLEWPFKEIINKLYWSDNIIRKRLQEWSFADTPYCLKCNSIDFDDGVTYAILATNNEKTLAYLIRLPEKLLNRVYKIRNDKIWIEFTEDNHAFRMFSYDENNEIDITEFVITLKSENWQIKVIVPKIK